MSDKVNDGGAAFPGTMFLSDRGGFKGVAKEGQSGMSLRDYFAATALQGMCVQFDGMLPPEQWDEELIAQDAYALADAMLAERAK